MDRNYRLAEDIIPWTIDGQKLTYDDIAEILEKDRLSIPCHCQGIERAVKPSDWSFTHYNFKARH